MKHLNLINFIFSFLLCALLLSGCGASSDAPGASHTADTATEDFSQDDTADAASNTVGSRDNTPVCLTPVASGSLVASNELASIDYSNTAEGYIMVQYTGSCPKVKLQITGPDSITYTYNLLGNDYETFPLSAGDGGYKTAVYENVSGDQYSLALSQDIDVKITNTFGPFLYPNQYVNFTADCDTVAKAAELAASADTDLDVVSNVYNYVISAIRYDYDKASAVQSGYLCDIDETLQKGTGICLDYACVMASMLRSQNIPTRMEVGYAGSAYHAWISTYIKDVGWVNGVIEFNGKDWELMDPTFAANSSASDLKNFIGDGSNYTTKYIY